MYKVGSVSITDEFITALMQALVSAGHGDLLQELLNKYRVVGADA